MFEQLAENLIHEGDLFGVVSTGLSSIAIDVTDDRGLLDEAAARIMGGGFDPNELIENFPPAPGGVPELRVRAQMAFNTMRDMIRSLETVQHLRKVVVYLSSGYDFNPFISERALYFRSRGATSPFSRLGAPRAGTGIVPSDPLSDGDLTREIAELAAVANRANASFYTVDPRGLVAGLQPSHYQLGNSRSFNAWIFNVQNSLRALSEWTGGRAIVNRNDFDEAFRQVDAETSDYYILGFTVGDADSMVRRSRVEVRGRDDIRVRHRSHYTLGGSAQNRPPR